MMLGVTCQPGPIRTLPQEHDSHTSSVLGICYPLPEIGLLGRLAPGVGGWFPTSSTDSQYHGAGSKLGEGAVCVCVAGGGSSLLLEPKILVHTFREGSKAESSAWVLQTERKILLPHPDPKTLAGKWPFQQTPETPQRQRKLLLII